MGVHSDGVLKVHDVRTRVHVQEAPVYRDKVAGGGRARRQRRRSQYAAKVAASMMIKAACRAMNLKNATALPPQWPPTSQADGKKVPPWARAAKQLCP